MGFGFPIAFKSWGVAKKLPPGRKFLIRLRLLPEGVYCFNLRAIYGTKEIGYTQTQEGKSNGR